MSETEIYICMRYPGMTEIGMHDNMVAISKDH